MLKQKSKSKMQIISFHWMQADCTVLNLLDEQCHKQYLEESREVQLEDLIKTDWAMNFEPREMSKAHHQRILFLWIDLLPSLLTSEALIHDKEQKDFQCVKCWSVVKSHNNLTLLVFYRIESEEQWQRLSHIQNSYMETIWNPIFNN